MMIKFVEIDGLYCPVFGQPIQGKGSGLVQWNRYDEPTFTVLHKGPDMPCSWQ
jgi:hypothetical protein